jgi:hypothetical protein
MCVWGCPAEAKVFNQNIGKLDPKTVSCHFIGYTEKSKGYRFYCPNGHTKFVETRHAIFLENEIIRGSKAARKIDLEEKQVCAPTPMVEEPYFVMPTVPTAKVQPTMVPEPVVSSPVQPVIENEETVHQCPIETTDAQEEPQQPQLQEAPADEAPRRSQRVRKPAIPDDYEVYNCEKIHIEGNPSSYEEAMSRPDASKWQEAMEDEMKSMSTNRVWDLEEIPKGAKTVGYKWVYKTKYDSKGI